VDAGTISGSDLPLVMLAFNVVDAGTLSGSDTAAMAGAINPVDTGSVNSSETYATTAAVTLADSSNLDSSDDGASAMDTTQSRVVVYWAELQVPDFVVTVNDSGTLNSGETRTVAVGVSQPDAGTLTGTIHVNALPVGEKRVFDWDTPVIERWLQHDTPTIETRMRHHRTYFERFMHHDQPRVVPYLLNDEGDVEELVTSDMPLIAR
jgi:hypothetical protein